MRGVGICAVLLLGLIAGAAAAPTHRKMLTLNTAQGPYPQRYGNTQLAANNRAIVNTQLAIDAAYESGANRYVTEAATAYGNDQAYLASQATKRCGWHSGSWWGPC